MKRTGLLLLGMLSSMVLASAQNVVDLGVSAGLGTATMVFTKAGFNGKAGLSYDAGISTQYNFGSDLACGIRVDALYTGINAKYPEVTNLFDASAKYKGSQLTVPVQFVYQARPDNENQESRVYCCIGGYYARRFTGEDPGKMYTVKKDDFGIAFGLGIRMSSHMALHIQWFDSIHLLYKEDAAPNTRQITFLTGLVYYL